jgi:hypothetical protein
MHKLLVMAATVLVAGSFVASALAQQPRAAREDNRPTVNQLVAQDEARLARLKAELRLKEDQEGDWKNFEAALLDLSRRRAERFVEWWDKGVERAKQAREARARERTREKEPQAPRPMTLAEGLRLRAEVMEKHAADLKKIADAAEPLFDKLDEPQKLRLSQLVHLYATRPVAEASDWRDRRGGR